MNKGAIKMKMRIPSIPLIAIDPYFSVWSHDVLNDRHTTHWTGARNAMIGELTVDGEAFCFLGKSSVKKMKQISLDMNAMTTTAVFETEKIRLTACFTSPLLATDLYLSSRPVSYLHLACESLDGQAHELTAKVSCSEEFCLNCAGESRALSETVECGTLSCIKMGNGVQNVLHRSGDNVRIDWGYFYLATDENGKVGTRVFDNMYALYAETKFETEALFVFAYDDIKSITYFGEQLDAYWKKDGKTITEAIAEAYAEYDSLYKKCTEFSEKLEADAKAAGGENYSELLVLAYRQVMAAHKLVVDKKGNNLYISKECFSNGCAATVDVTYPSAPMYLYYNTELLKGMLRPVFAFARTDAWKFDFAPHDCGQYPLLNGQFYNTGSIEGQMPVEECGNLIVLVSAICEKDGNVDFALENLDLLEKWCQYLVDFGEDPENQLCTDDFAGHLPHNCNLSLKAIMGMAGFSRILKALGRVSEADELMKTAKNYADSFLERAKNDDGSTALGYHLKNTFSLKYNSVWDRLWKTSLLPDSFYQNEIIRYKKEALPYGVPLDSREKYTKSDWILWAACLADKKEDFEFFCDLLWNAYNTMRTRVPMTDWYYADTSSQVGFQHRTVQGGLFLKLLF